MSTDTTTDTTGQDAAGGDEATTPRSKVNVVAVIDKSGSMTPVADDVRGGYNSFLDSLVKDLTADYTITTVLFDHEIHTLGVNVPVAEAVRLDHRNYVPMGNTALNDGVMAGLLGFESRHTEPFADGERAILFVATDGHENNSREFRDSRVVKAKIAANKATGRWTDMFVGSGPGAWAAGDRYGSQTIPVLRTAGGTASGYSAMTAAATTYASGADRAATFSVAESTAAAGEQ